MNTARQSAVNIKLNPSGRFFETVMTLPDKTAGTMRHEQTRDVITNKKESTFRRRSDMSPIKGRRADPKTGTNIVKSIKISFDISITQIKKSQFLFLNCWLFRYFFSEHLPTLNLTVFAQEPQVLFFDEWTRRKIDADASGWMEIRKLTFTKARLF